MVIKDNSDIALFAVSDISVRWINPGVCLENVSYSYGRIRE